MDLSEIQQHLNQVMDEQNNRSIPEFEGYSPSEMHQILHFTFEPKSPLRLQNLTDSEYKKIPILNLTKYFLDLIKKHGEIKLTAKGFLPTKIVKEIYDQGFFEEYQFASGLSKLYKESDSVTINLTRLLAELSGLTKIRNGKLSLTKTGEMAIADNFKLLELIFKTMATKFNWSYYDRYEENQIGQLGYGFTLILLSKYGNEKRLDSFYAKKYFKAFPQFLESISPSYGTVESYAANCYSLRTFERFMDYFGLVNVDKQGEFGERKTFITKTGLFDKLINVLPHNSEFEKQTNKS